MSETSFADRDADVESNAKKYGVSSELLLRFQKIQAELKLKVDTTAAVPASCIKYVGGLDISFSLKHPDTAAVALTVFEYNLFTKGKTFNAKNVPKPVYTDSAIVKLTLPYIPGYLAFREVEHYQAALDRIKKEAPHFFPDLLLVDGNGIFHPRLGAASHLGVLCDMASIGVSKTFFDLDGMNEGQTRNNFAARCQRKNDTLELVGASGRVWGVALKTTEEKNSKNAIYVSIGHKIDLTSTVAIVRNLSVFRIPEPIRMADQLGRERIRNFETEQDCF